MDEAASGCIATVIVIGVVIYIIAILAMVSLVIAMVVLGLMSIFMARSNKKALVTQEKASIAFVSAVSWAGTLAVGCMIGSVGLLITLHFAIGGDYGGQVIAFHTQDTYASNWSAFLSNWIVLDALRFFLSVSVLLYLTNRVHIALKKGGTHWLGVIPPICAIVIFFFAKHWAFIFELIETRELPAIKQLALMALQEIRLPFDLILLLFTDRASLVEWGQTLMYASEGSLFQLADFFPSIFVLVALAFAAQNTIDGGALVPS